MTVFISWCILFITIRCIILQPSRFEIRIFTHLNILNRRCRVPNFLPLATGLDMTTWIKIEAFQCPGKDCPNNSILNKWVCSEDGSDLFMSQTGYIRCGAVKDYNTFNDSQKFSHIDKICNCQWNCDNHRQNGYQDTNKECFILSMSMALQMIKAKGKAKWISALILELGNQFGEEDDSDKDMC